MSKVLVVDDAAANRRILGLLLKRAGHEVVAAATADEALLAFAKHRPDVVLTDLHLGSGLDGIGLARRLRAQERGEVIRIGLMTGDALQDVEPTDSVDKILVKPVMLKDVVSLLEGIV